jgi:Zn finger protein HypA/HybF involved in hydrogenase expression
VPYFRLVHEVGLVATALAQAVAAARAAGATRVHHLAFTVAPDGHVSPDAIVTLVAMLARGTLVEGATVEVQPAPAGAPVPALTLVSIDAELPAAEA